MNRYHLAKLVQWCGTLKSRKRLQKVVFLLKASGCPLSADYTLHHYGPYSTEVARLSDEMVQVGLLDEKPEPNNVGTQYAYSLSDASIALIAQFEKTSKGKLLAKQISQYEARAKELLSTDLRLLEIASTIVYFRKQGEGWPLAKEKTSKFKNLPANSAILAKAEGLAQQFVS